jgi:PAS domain S-box-containing protein
LAGEEDDTRGLRETALRNIEAILSARRKAEGDLVASKDELELRTIELRDQREWFAVTLSSIGDAVIATDAAGKVTFMNPVAATMTGFSSDESKGLPLDAVFRIVNEHTGKTAENPVAEVFRTGRVVGLANHTTLVGRDGTRTPIEDSAAPIRNAEGAVTGAVIVFHDVTRRRRAETALRESEQRLRAVFDQVPVGIGVVGLDARIEQVNRRFSEILGYSQEELRMMTFADFTHPDDLAITREHVERLREGHGKGYTLEKRYIRKDGGVVWSRTAVEILRDAQGRPYQYVGIIEDITSRKRAEEDLLAGSRRLRLALEAGKLSDWSWDKKTDIITMAPQMKAHYELPPDRVVKAEDLRPLLEIEDAAKTRAEAARAMAERTPFSLEYRIKPPSGKKVWIAARGQAEYDADGAVTGMVGVLQNITQEKEADLALRRYAALVESSEDAIISKTLSGVITTWNRGAEAMFGFTAAEAIGGSIMLLVPDDLAGEEATILTRLNRGERIEHYETLRRRKDGTLVNVSLSVSGIRGPNGKIIGASKIARDITRQKEVERALRETDQRKDEFLATLAHELRNPLAPIRQAATVSQAPGATEAQKRWSHGVISRQVQHMALLLDDLLDISRITRGTLELRPEMTELQSVVDAAVETARPALDSRHHTFTVELPPQPVGFVADPLRLSQVLANLLTNAAKYTDPGGSVRLRATLVDDLITISVLDTGLGIPKEALENVFAMFSQVKGTHDRSEGGLGIGLSLSRGLVQLHGGTIEAKSAGPGQGSEFIVRLPRKVRAQTPVKQITGGTARKAPSRRVLVADDNRDAAESLAMLLSLEGHTVETVHDGHAALEAIESFKPEIALLDIGMPGLNGYELAKQIRKGPLGTTVTLVAVTGWGQDNDKARALAAGFNHHFTKPVEPERLIELLRSEMKG